MGMANVYVEPYRTRVYKSGNTWIVSYYSFGGPLWVGFATWRRAMTEAFEVEKQRAWG